MWGPAARGGRRAGPQEPRETPGRRPGPVPPVLADELGFTSAGAGGEVPLLQVTTGIWDWSLHVAFRVLALPTSLPAEGLELPRAGLVPV